MPLGLYVSVPFCRTKCTFCNFASDVFSRAVFAQYVERVCTDIRSTTTIAEKMGGILSRDVDSVYLGGGTPTVLDSQQLEQIFVTVRQEFCLLPDAEITVECAPGTLTPALLETLLRCGVNRISLGVQSFIDQESASVGRLHKRATVRDDITRLHNAGISNINIDLIAGLPHQTSHSWGFSLEETISSGAPHASVYMLEVDEDSRLGRELMAGGTRYHAHFVPDEELTADLYLAACDRLNAAGIGQYEISNFARPGKESRHNLKYWTRDPYVGFGVDAHSMSPDRANPLGAVRWSTPYQLEKYVAGSLPEPVPVTVQNALEESLFLGLRLNRGVDIKQLEEQFGLPALAPFEAAIAQNLADGLLERSHRTIRLTPRGRLLSNEVFQSFLAIESEASAKS